MKKYEQQLAKWRSLLSEAGDIQASIKPPGLKQSKEAVCTVAAYFTIASDIQALDEEIDSGTVDAEEVFWFKAVQAEALANAAVWEVDFGTAATYAAVGSDAITVALSAAQQAGPSASIDPKALTLLAFWKVQLDKISAAYRPFANKAAMPAPMWGTGSRAYLDIADPQNADAASSSIASGSGFIWIAALIAGIALLSKK